MSEDAVVALASRLLPALEKKRLDKLKAQTADILDAKRSTQTKPRGSQLNGLENIRDGRTVLIVDSLSALEAATEIVGESYAVVFASVKDTDWEPIRGHKVIVWVKADSIAVGTKDSILATICGKPSETKWLDVSGEPNDWDALSAKDSGWTPAMFEKFFSDRGRIWGNKPPDVAPELFPVDPGDGPKAPVTAMEAWTQCGMMLNKRNEPLLNMANIQRVLERYGEFGDFAWIDEFHKHILTKFRTGAPHPWDDGDKLVLLTFMQDKLGLNVTSHMIDEAVIAYAHRRPIRNEPREWMNSLCWDSTHRIEQFFVTHLGSRDSAYARAASKNLWVAMAARIFDPGCKFDNMTYLYGGQGRFKSMAVDIIGGAWAAVAQEKITEKDFYQCLHGKLVVEIAELDSFNKVERSKVKQVVSTRIDRYRVSYGRNAEDHRRMSVFIGTTNDPTPLRDNENRRFWPVHIGEIDLAAIRRDREQLFAEAVSAFTSGVSWWNMPTVETKEVQEANREPDPWEEPIAAWLDDPARGFSDVTTWQVAEGALNLLLSGLGTQEQRRIGHCLRYLGWEDRVTWSAAVGRSIRSWRRVEPEVHPCKPKPDGI